MGVLHNLPPQPVSTKGIKPEAVPQLKQMVVKMMGWEKGPAFFPGSQPVSFESKHLRTLLTERYFACEKTDGVRYMCLICKWGACLICREFKFYPLQCSFPSRDGGPLDSTLLDGELVYDKLEDGTGFEWRYYIYDMMVLQGRCVMDDPLYVRLMHVRNHILAPRERMPPPKEKELIAVAIKEMYEVRHLPQLFRDIIPVLPHGNDGIIFTKVFSPYLCGTDNTLLKWKPAELNTVDFTLETVYGGPPGNKETRYILCCANQGVAERFSFIHFSPEQYEMFRKDTKLASKAVLECVYDPAWMSFYLKEGVDLKQIKDWDDDVDWKKGGWKFLRIREDKTTANDKSVIEKIKRSVADNVSKDALLEVAAILTEHHAKVREEWEAVRLEAQGKAGVRKPAAAPVPPPAPPRPAPDPRSAESSSSAEPPPKKARVAEAEPAQPAPMDPAAGPFGGFVGDDYGAYDDGTGGTGPPAAPPANPIGPYDVPEGPSASYSPHGMLSYDEG